MATIKQIEQAKKKVEYALQNNENRIFDMTITNKNEAVKAKGFLNEAVASLQVAKDEREHLNDIAEAACDEFAGKDKEERKEFKLMFKKTVGLVFKGKLDEENNRLEDCKEFYNSISVASKGES